LICTAPPADGVLLVRWLPLTDYSLSVARRWLALSCGSCEAAARAHSQAASVDDVPPTEPEELHHRVITRRK